MKKAIFCFICVGLVLGCNGKDTTLNIGNTEYNIKDFYLFNTEEYNKKISTLNLTPTDAAKKIIEWRQSEAGASVIIKYPGEHHYLMIGDWYVFSRYEKTGGVNLSGFYVDGITGEVEKRDLGWDAILTPSQQEKICGRTVPSISGGYIYKPE